MPSRFARTALLFLTLAAIPSTACRDDNPSGTRDAAASADGNGASVSVQTALALAEELAAGEEPLDPAMDAAGNAAIIQGNASVALGTCGAVSLVGTTVTVTFAPGGCALPSGLTATGAVSLSASVIAGTVTVDASFDALSVGSYSLDGTASISTTNGTSYTAMIDLTSEGRTISGDLTVSATLAALTISGDLTTRRTGGAVLSVRIVAMRWDRGDCYPSAGSITVGVGVLAQTITFSSATPSTGEVSVAFGRTTTTETLPAYGMCP